MPAAVETVATILFAHGARDPEWAEPMRRVRAAMLARAPTRRVELAFLELMSPTLDECVRALVAAGHGSIRIVPLFIARGGHLKNDLPRLVDALRAAYPHVRFVLVPPVGEASAVITAMAEHALDPDAGR